MRSRFPSDMMTLEERERNYTWNEIVKILMLRANIGIRVIVAWMYVYIYIYILTIDVITKCSNVSNAAYLAGSINSFLDSSRWRGG